MWVNGNGEHNLPSIDCEPSAIPWKHKYPCYMACVCMCEPVIWNDKCYLSLPNNRKDPSQQITHIFLCGKIRSFELFTARADIFPIFGRLFCSLNEFDGVAGCNRGDVEGVYLVWQ